jgi:threonylcarbamoyladenosine tRNA methylthiotransferase MtaB
MGQTARTIAFHTLGCKLNYSETSALGRMMEAEGFLQKNFSENADVYVINTCSVTENADKECRQLVRRIQRKNPEAFVVITGCYAQLKPEEIASIEGVDLVLGASEKFNLASHIKELSKGDSARISSCDIDHIEGFHSAYSLTGRTRTFLKVQDGCDYNCTFCTIPLARGHSRSDTIERVKENVKHLAGQGVKEIVLTGINLGDFGKGFEGGKRSTESFLDLLYALDKESDIKRYRISSIEPNLLSSEIISLVAASEKFMPHFHIPLQSGSDRILGLMRRRYRRQLYAEKVAEIRSLMPDACIGVDVITGFPSESEEDFQETLSFLQNIDISYLHVFTYSERANTPALDIKPVVPQSVRQERTRILRQFSYQTMQQFEVRHKGQTRKVLFESVNKNGMMEGYTDNYIRVQTPYRKEWENEIVDWVLG